MRRTTVISLVAAASIVAGTAAIQAKLLQEDAAKLEIEVIPYVESVSWEEIKIGLDLVLTNPTLSTISFNVPAIGVYLGESLVAAKQQQGQRITLRPGSKQRLRDLTGSDLMLLVDIDRALAASRDSLIGFITGAVSEIPVLLAIRTVGYAELIGIPVKKAITIIEPHSLKLPNYLP